MAAARLAPRRKLQRGARLSEPGVHSAGEVYRAIVAERIELLGDVGAARSEMADHDDVAIRRQLAESMPDFVHRNVNGAGDYAIGQLVRLANVQQEWRVAIEAAPQFAYRNRLHSRKHRCLVYEKSAGVGVGRVEDRNRKRYENLIEQHAGPES
jgi:hypothetical protein